MYGCGSGTALLVNAEVDSMGGVVDGGVSIGVKTSLRRAAIEKAQAELRQEYDVREERRRELEFLEKGGNPLDFKFGNAASVSVQSTSLTDQLAEHFVTSEAKGSFALTASPHGDSVESSGRPRVPTVCEPNSADNLLLFDGENELLESERNSIHPVKRINIVPSEQSSQMDGNETQNAKESEDSAIFRPYARRNRSKIKRDSARSNSNDIFQTRVGDRSSLTVRGSSRDAKGLISDSNNQKDQNMLSATNPKAATSNGNVGSKVVTSDNHANMDLYRVQSTAVTSSSKASLPDDELDVTAPKRSTDGHHNQFAQVDTHQTPIDVASGKPDFVGGNEHIVSAGVDCLPCEATEKAANENCSNQENGFGDQVKDGKSIPTEGENSTAAIGTKLDSESSCTQNSLSVDVNNDNDVCVNSKSVDSNGFLTEQTSDLEGTVHLTGSEMVKEENEIKVDSDTAMNDDQNSTYQNHSNNNSMVKVEEEIITSKSDLQNEANCTSNIEGLPQKVQTMSETDKNLINVLGCNSNSKKENLCSRRSQGTLDISTCEPPETAVLGRSSADASHHQTESVNYLKLADKAHEDSVLKEARIIEAKRKRIVELSVGTFRFETRQKSHWDFVLKEMAWLANDFAQERLWKMTAAAQICNQAAFISRMRSEKQNQRYKLKKVALNQAKAVMQFWHSAEVRLNNDDPTVGPKTSRRGSVGSTNDVSIEASKDKETSKNLMQQCPRKNVALAIHGYAVGFLKHNRSLVLPLQAEAPATPDRISDSGIMDASWDDHLTEESLFYAVSSGAMETYRKSIESHIAQCEKTASSMQEEVDTSMYDAVAEFSYHDPTYDEDEGEASAYYLPGAFEGSKSSKFAHMKKKNLIKYTGRSYEMGADIPYGHGSVGSQQSIMGKRPTSSLNVGSIPTKRMRTASRQRILGPFSAGLAGNLQAPTKTHASSGDTSSFQDDQTLLGGSQIQKSVEVESAGDFEKQLPYDYAETSTKPKKKKAKHLGSAFEQDWQLESTVYSEQRDHSKKRLEGRHFDSNGNNGLYGQHNVKKTKIMKQSLETTFDNITPRTGSIPSPVASQISNMSNPNFIKLIGGRDRGRKAKVLKMSAGQPGSGSPWSLFEDQALVVLVHDMGPNWELVSDVMNSTLQFKCIFRKPQECKERHKILMDRGAGDGADSAEDSGSSQSYPSTLPGIPKGSARQLFQRLQGPMEEDTVKSHFEKIIMIGKKYHYRKRQNDNHDPRHVVPAHSSHVIALSQVSPNNLNGGILTPLDLCDLIASSPDAFQGSHASGLGISNQGAMLHTSGANSPLQGSSGIVLGSNMSSPSGPLNHPVRDGRYNVPRANLPVDEQQQRMQQYNQMLSGRNIQQSNLPAPGPLSGAERGVHMLAGGNGMGRMCGMNRSMPMSRTGFQGMASSPMLNSGSMLSSGMVGMSPVNMHSGAGPGQGNSILRPREAMHMMRPGQNPDHQRQIMVPELQMQVTQGNGQGIPAFSGLSSAFSNQTTPAPVQMYPGYTQQPHQMSPQQSHGLSNHPHPQGPNHATGLQQQAYAMCLPKERQIQQQRYLQQQQQQQFAAPGALMPHVQRQSQLPISSSLQNNTQIQPQTSSQPVSMPPITSSSMTPIALQHQQKHHLPSHGLSRNSPSGASGLNSQVGKHRQQQPQQQQLLQSGRNHPQLRQHAQSQQQAKLLKGIARGNMVLHQNLNVDHLNGLNVAPGNQAAEKGEQMMHLMQGQGLYSGSTLSPVQPSKPLVPSQSTNHSQPQQKLFSGPTPPSLNQLQQVLSHSDNSTQGQVPSVSSGNSPSATHQATLPAIMASNHPHLQLQPQPHQKQVNLTQTQPTAQRMHQQNCQLNSDLPNKSQTDQPQANQSVSSASLIGASATTALSQFCIDSGNIRPVSSAVAPQWKASEPVYDSGIPKMANHVGSIGSPPLTNSGGSDTVTSVSQGLGQRQLAGSLPPHGHNVGSPWQQQSQLQQSPTPQPASQQHCLPQDPQVLQQDQQQLPPQLQSHQQTQHLQVAQDGLYIRPTNAKLE